MSQTRDPLKEDFRNFLYMVWKFLGLPDPTKIQYDIAYYLQHGERRKAIIAYRGCGKSWITATYVVWLLYRDPVNEKILVTSASKDRADAFSIFTKQLIYNIPLLSHLKPEPGRRDSNIAFDVGPASISQSPSVKSAGITGQITGSRATRIISDDVEVPNNSLTQLQRERLAERIREYEAIILPGGEITFLGTPQTEASIYNSLPEKGYAMRIWPVRKPEESKVINYRGFLAPIIEDMDEPPLTPVDPARFNEDDLRQREASYGKSGFGLQFMLDTTLSDAERYPLKTKDLIVMDVNVDMGPLNVAWGSGEDQQIDELESVGFPGDRWHKPIFTSDEWKPYDYTVMYIDPAGRGADDVGYAVVKKIGSLLFLSTAGGKQGGYDDVTLKELGHIAKTHKVNKIIIEPNFGDGMYLKLFRPVVTKIHKCSVEDAPWNTTRKESRIINILEPVMMQHRLIVDRSIIEADMKRTDRSKMLFYQMTRIMNIKDALAHDDALEAVAGAVFYFMEDIGVLPEDNLERFKEDAMQEELNKILKIAGQYVGPPKFIDTQGRL